MKSAHGQLRDILKQAKRLQIDAEKALSAVRDERGHIGEPVELIDAAVTDLGSMIGRVDDYFRVTAQETANA